MVIMVKIGFKQQNEDIILKSLNGNIYEMEINPTNLKYYEDFIVTNEVEIEGALRGYSNMKCEKAKEFLVSTDWILAKIAEVSLIGTPDEISLVKENHKGTLLERAKMRKLVNDIDVAN